MTGEGNKRTSWLCRTAAERERVLDMEHRIKPLRAASMALLAVALLISGPWVGWWTLAPLAIATIAFAVTDRGLERSRHPEYRVAAAWLVAELAIAASVALTGGPRSPAVAWIGLPVVTLAARFNRRGVAAGVCISAVLMLATTFGVHPAYALAHPQNTLLPIALLGAVALLSMALMESDLQYRSASVIDPLTSMLNRNALRARVDELSHQSAIVHQPIGVIVADVDCFKEVNDSHGHAAGDAVLRDIAYRLRKRLRAFDLSYRMGGEEFLVLLPGADTDQAAAVAEDLRAAIAGEMFAGLQITVSFGVAASEPGHFDYHRTFAAADRALYDAKAAGRDCVRLAAASHEQDAPARPAFRRLAAERSSALVAER